MGWVAVALFTLGLALVAVPQSQVVVPHSLLTMFRWLAPNTRGRLICFSEFVLQIALPSERSIRWRAG